MQNECFNCDCGGKVKVINDTTILHACKHKYSPATSYYDGIDHFIQYDRIQISPKLTNGEIKYNWYVHYITTPIKSVNK